MFKFTSSQFPLKEETNVKDVIKNSDENVWNSVKAIQVSDLYLLSLLVWHHTEQTWQRPFMTLYCHHVDIYCKTVPRRTWFRMLTDFYDSPVAVCDCVWPVVMQGTHVWGWECLQTQDCPSQLKREAHLRSISTKCSRFFRTLCWAEGQNWDITTLTTVFTQT